MFMLLLFLFGVKKNLPRGWSGGYGPSPRATSSVP